MALTVQVPTSGAVKIIGAAVSTPLPSGVTVQVPTGGQLKIIGAMVVGTLSGGVFTPGQLTS